ncbi:MAG: nicotinate phosphoribosyltransferase [Candidatus Bathyarchaeota archaeon]|nr:nicotinate phosphoribosyltransferase [Candidatus Bathyarchaeota archaeon]
MKPTAEQNSALLTDLYQLTMNASYLDNSKADEVASFEMFIRSLPKDWGYFVAVGLDEAIDYACTIRFTDDDVAYLQSLNTFSDEYLDYLRHFRFEGEITTLQEGTPITINSPMLRVTAKRPQAQLLETALLNIVNFQTLIASKASRVVNAAGRSKVIDFGLRRAQGFDAGVKGARAEYIAGVSATSNVEAAKDYNLPPSGTMAHSFIMGFPDETDAYRAYAHTFPNDSVFLIDTYDTLMGTKKAATVAKEMEAQGHHLKAVRVDSGNMRGLSKRIRRILDAENLQYVKIVVSSDLNEYKIDTFTRKGAPVDSYGVGTEMITAKPVSALPGVYKLVEDNYGPRIKLSDRKKTYPGRKQLCRIEKNGKYLNDVLQLDEEAPVGEPLLKKVATNGHRTHGRLPLEEIRDYSIESVSKLPEECKKIRRPEPYPLRISERLQTLTTRLTSLYADK